jgi:hypothetical protein
MGPREFVGIIGRCAYDFGVEAGKVIFAVHYPAMMEASMKKATQVEGGTREREMHFQATGHVPTAKGIQIGINNVNRQTDDREPEPGEAPQFSRTARRVVRDLPA